jgi:phage gp16-like protein
MSHRDMLAKIHIARKDLALDEDAYRGLLQRVAGVASARDLTDRQADAVIAELKRLGWKPTVSARPPAARADLRKVYALWGALHAGPLNRDALRQWVRNRFGVSAPEFLKPAQAREAIEQLKAWQKRVMA